MKHQSLNAAENGVHKKVNLPKNNRENKAKKKSLFPKNRPGELFLHLYPAGGITPISIFPSLNLKKI